jgi:hypothetical protein
MHYFATDHPRGRIRQGSYPVILGTRPYPFTVDPPRPVLDPASTHRRSTRKKDRHDTEPRVFSPSHPLRHHGVRGWPAILRARRYNSLHSVRQNFTSKDTPGVPASSYPIKGQAGSSTKGGTTNNRRRKISLHPTKEINISSNPLCTVTFSLRPGIDSLSHSL